LRLSSTTILKALLAYAACHAVFYSLSSPRTSNLESSSRPARNTREPSHIVPHWPPGTNISMYVYLSGTPNADVFAESKMQPQLVARRKRKAEMYKKGYIGHGAYKKPLEKTDPDYGEQMRVMRQMRNTEKKRQARLKREAEEPAQTTAEDGEIDDSAEEAPSTVQSDVEEKLQKKRKPRGGISQWLTAPQKPPPKWPLSFVWDNIIYGDMNDRREIDLNVGLPFSAQRNSPIYADVFLTVNGSHPDPMNPLHVSENIHHVRTSAFYQFSPSSI